MKLKSMLKSIIVKAKDLPLVITLITARGEQKDYILKPCSNGEKICLNKKDY